MKIPKVEMKAGFAGYIRGDYVIDNETLNKLVKAEVMRMYPFIEAVDENKAEDAKLAEEIKHFIKVTAEGYYHAVQGEMDIVRDDTDTTYLQVELKEA